MLHELILIKERGCPVCKATDVFIFHDPEIVRRFLLTRLDRNIDSDELNMAEYWEYADYIGAEIYPTIIMGIPEKRYYPYIFHIWKKGKPNPVEISEEERLFLQELKKQILEMDKKLEEEVTTFIAAPYEQWKETFGLKEI